MAITTPMPWDPLVDPLANQGLGVLNAQNAQNALNNQSLANVPNQQWYHNQIARSQLAAAQAQPLTSSHYHETHVRSVVSVYPIEHIAREKITRCCREFPMGLLAKINAISLAFTDTGTMYFVVQYASGRRADFTEVDEFPTDADMARIALEATL
jgi:hypothetical protein